MENIILYILLVFGISLGLTMLALVDIIKKDFGSPKTKLLWHFIALIPLVGWLIYLMFGYGKGHKKSFTM
ncbi:MAG: PLDc N-terminal domain-containing protein [Desulfobacteraceae bacterium]|nr:PLDc N-terminal domain-containing protein [Desulfobacteraceae bacterium]